MTDEYLTIQEAAKMLKSRQEDVMATIIQGGVNWTRVLTAAGCARLCASAAGGIGGGR